MPVNIHGKEYRPVVERIGEFREKFGFECGISTDLIESTDERVVVKATLIETDGRIVATGYAEEVRGSSNINKTSALENCETSAIGRCLANAGYAGTEYASADEVANAIKQQAAIEHIEYMAVVRDNWKSIAAIKESIFLHLQAIENGMPDVAQSELSAGVEASAELGNEIKLQLQRAPTKGGVFTTKERAVMKSDEWHQAREAYYGR